MEWWKNVCLKHHRVQGSCDHRYCLATMIQTMMPSPHHLTLRSDNEAEDQSIFGYIWLRSGRGSSFIVTVALNTFNTFNIFNRVNIFNRFNIPLDSDSVLLFVFGSLG